MARTKHARKRPNGGKRPGAGRKMTTNGRLDCRLRRDTLVKLGRYAQSIGMSGVQQRKAFWDKVFTALLGKIDLPEPEYLTLARAITVWTVK